jgi:hypothetical protein
MFTGLEKSVGFIAFLSMMEAVIVNLLLKLLGDGF